jgi:hypothetical protein
MRTAHFPPSLRTHPPSLRKLTGVSARLHTPQMHAIWDLLVCGQRIFLRMAG